MAEWKFGTVIDGPLATIMLIGVSDGSGAFKTTDHYRQVIPENGWYGVTLVEKIHAGDPDPGAYGRPGEITWVIGRPDDSEWEVLEDE